MFEQSIYSRILKRFLYLLLLLFASSMIAFLLVTYSPLDPIEAYIGSDKTVSPEQVENIKEYWGLNQPPAERYIKWLRNVLHGDWGNSLIYRKPVIRIIGQRVQASLALMITAWLFSGLLGFALGLIAGKNEGKPADRVIRFFSYVLASMPVFWFGLLMLTVFAIRLKWFPIALAVPIGTLQEEVTLADRIHHLILPALTLSVVGIANITLHTREKLIEVRHSEYHRYAVSRGETERDFLRHHGLRNVMIPALTLQFASFSELFGGSVLAEQVFSYPGLGSAITAAALGGDIPLLLAVSLFSAIFVFTGNLIADVLYMVLDPRIRAEGARG